MAPHTLIQDRSRFRCILRPPGLPSDTDPQAKFEPLLNVCCAAQPSRRSRGVDLSCLAQMSRSTQPSSVTPVRRARSWWLGHRPPPGGHRPPAIHPASGRPGAPGELGKPPALALTPHASAIFGSKLSASPIFQFTRCLVGPSRPLVRPLYRHPYQAVIAEMT